MEVLKKIVIVILFISFLLLGVALIRVYLDVSSAKEYVEFITESTNSLVVQVDQVNLGLNELQYEEGQQYLQNLQSDLNSIELTLEEIDNQKARYKVDKNREEVDGKFVDYLEEVKSLAIALEEMVDSIESLEEKEVFEARLEVYVKHSNELQAKSRLLERDLQAYIQNYTKLDFERIVDGFKFI